MADSMSAGAGPAILKLLNGTTVAVDEQVGVIADDAQAE